MSRQEILQRLKTQKAERLKGDVGATGNEGPRGEKGLTGDQGERGLQGIQGKEGLSGRQGIQGAKGADGQDGQPGESIVWRDQWRAGLEYSANQAVYNAGSAYICIDYHKSTSQNEPPTGGTWKQCWAVMAERGEAGQGGRPGTDGIDGVGVPIGGTTNQVLAKHSDDNFDTAWVDASTGGAAVWGGITGDLPDQLDLEAALNDKVEKAGDTMTGNLTVPSQTIQDFNLSPSTFYTEGVVPGLLLQNNQPNIRTLLGIVPNGSAGLADLWVFNTSDTTDNYSALAWGYEGSSHNWGINVAVGGTESAKGIYFNATNGQSAVTSNLYMATDGRVGIGGNIAPAYMLDVNGDINVPAGHNFKIDGVNLPTSTPPDYSSIMLLMGA